GISECFPTCSADRRSPTRRHTPSSQSTLMQAGNRIEDLTTDQVQSLAHELQVCRSELARTRDFFESAPVGLLVLDEQGQIRSANRAVADLLATERSKVVGRKLSHLLCPDSHDTLYRAQRKLKEVGQRVSCEVTMRRGKATFDARLDLSMRMTCQTAADVLVALNDITDLKRAERAERAVQGLKVTLEQRVADQTSDLRLYAEAIASLGEGVVITDASNDPFDSSILFVNEAICQLTGHDATELVGQSPQLLHGKQTDLSILREIRRATTANQSFQADLVFYRRDGTPWNVDLFVTPILDRNQARTHFVMIQRDITERTRASQRELQSARLAAIGEAMAGLVHESRNALNRTQAALRMIERRTRQQPGLAPLIAEAREAQLDVQRLFEEVRHYAAPLVLNRKRCELASIVNKAWQDVIAVHPQRDAAIQQHVDGALRSVKVCPSTMSRALRNVFDNAIVATPDPVRVDVTFSTATYDQRSSLRIAIHDNGPGLTSEGRDRVFEPFYTTKTEGTGLGMAIAKRIVEAHGGTIDVGDNEPSGAEFILTLPME
ncbi:MAG: PAS domain S-box protein, partial [Planctomycetota bacterium]